MSRVYNFSAGPAVLPEEVLKEAAAEMLDRTAGRGVASGIRKRNVFSHAMRRGKPDLTRKWKDRKTKAARPA